MTKNKLYYGDNLAVLRRYTQDESVDLVYLDPPFKSDQDYNVLFAEQDGSRAAAQIKAFGDMWQWDEASARAYQDVVEAGGQVSQVLPTIPSACPLRPERLPTHLVRGPLGPLGVANPVHTSGSRIQAGRSRWLWSTRHTSMWSSRLT